MDYATAKTVYANSQTATQNYPAEPQAPQLASEGIISRLNNIRAIMADNRSSACSASDKIVGSAPTPIAGLSAGNGQIKGDRPPAQCFIDALQQVIGDIEDIMRDTQEHLNRLHRSF